jgi:hypothetical protein
MAYIDDVSIIAENFEAASKAVECLRTEALKLGLRMNSKKCEILSRSTPQKLSDTMSQFAHKKCVRLLGASVGFNNNDEKVHLEERFATTHELWFRRLLQMENSVGLAILAQCGIPKLNFVLRTHHPEVSMAIAQKFDSNVRATWIQWSNSEPDELSAILAQLPPKMGGIGLTKLSDIAHMAYQASLASIGASIDSAATQRTLKVDYDAKLAAKVDSNTLTQRTRQLNAQPGAQTLIRDPTFAATRLEFAAGLRTALCTTLKNCPATLECPCGFSGDKRTVLAHCATCVKVPGNNASATHQRAKHNLLQLCTEAKVACDSREPRDIRIAKCPGCSENVIESSWNDHKASCKKFDETSMTAPRAHGPDIRIKSLHQHLPAAQRPVDAKPVVVDVFQISATCTTNSNTQLAKIFSKREDEKHEHYANFADRNGERLIVAGATAEHGIPSRSTVNLLAEIAHAGGMNEHYVRKQYQGGIQAAHAASRVNAEKHLKLNLLAKLPQQTPTETEFSTRIVAQTDAAPPAPTISSNTAAQSNNAQLQRNADIRAPSEAPQQQQQPQQQRNAEAEFERLTREEEAKDRQLEAEILRQARTPQPQQQQHMQHHSPMPPLTPMPPPLTSLFSAANLAACSQRKDNDRIVPTTQIIAPQQPRATPTTYAANNVQRLGSEIAPERRLDMSQMQARHQAHLAPTRLQSQAAARENSMPPNALRIDSCRAQTPRPTQTPIHQQQPQRQQQQQPAGTIMFGNSPLRPEPGCPIFSPDATHEHITAISLRILRGELRNDALMNLIAGIVTNVRRVAHNNRYLSKDVVAIAAAYESKRIEFLQANGQHSNLIRVVLRSVGLADREGRMIAATNEFPPIQTNTANVTLSFGDSPVKANESDAYILCTKRSIPEVFELAWDVLGDMNGTEHTRFNSTRIVVQTVVHKVGRAGERVSRERIAQALASANNAQSAVASEALVANVRTILHLATLVDDHGCLHGPQTTTKIAEFALARFNRKSQSSNIAASSSSAIPTPNQASARIQNPLMSSTVGRSAAIAGN